MIKPPMYLGDAVYVRMDEFNGITLTTENGITTTNEIYLEPEVWQNLLEYMKEK